MNDGNIPFIYLFYFFLSSVFPNVSNVGVGESMNEYCLIGAAQCLTWVSAVYLTLKSFRLIL